MIDITSTSNEHFRRWKDISSARGIKKHREFILMGEKLIEEFLKEPTHKIKAELIHEELTAMSPGTAAAKAGRIPVYKLPKILFNELDVLGTHCNLLVLEAKEIAELKPGHKVSGLEVISPLGDPSNLGALARSALAFGASKMILTEECCSPYHPKAIKSSAGALLKLPLYRTKKLKDYVEGSSDVYALDMKGENVAKFKWPKDLQLVIGEEGPGLSGLKGLQRLSVPTHGVESLNATVAASIALFTYASSKN